MPDFFHLALMIFAALFFMVFVGVGLIVVAAGVDTFLRRRASAGWAQTSARIIASDVETGQFDEQTVYRPRVTYVFSAANREWTSTRLSFTGRSYASEKGAQEVCRRYPAETSAPVLYNPAHPQESVLERQGGAPAMMLVLCGLLCWVGPVAGLLFLGVPWWLSAAVLFSLAGIVVWLFGWERRALDRARREGLYPPPGEESPEAVRTLLRHGKKALAIHLFRQIHGVNMKTARLEIAKIQREMVSGPTA